MLYRRGTTWWVKFKSNGKRVRRSTGKTARGEAKREALQIIAAERRATPARSPGRGSGRLITLAAEAEAAAIRRGLSDGEVQATGIIWRNLLDHFGEDTSVRDVTAEQIAAYEGVRRSKTTRRRVAKGKWVETPAGIRGQTIRRELGRLRRGMQTALARGWLHALPAFPKIRKEPARAGRKGRVIPIAKALDAISRMPPEAGAEYTVALLTNLREAELHRLEASWIEAAPKKSGVPAIFRVPAAAAKDREERVIGCPQIVLDVLGPIAAEIPSGPLFPRSRWQNRRAIRTASRASGVPFRITLRDMRKTYASIAGASESVAAIGASLGHEDLETTSIYVEAELSKTVAVSAAVASAWKAAKGPQRQGPQSKKKRTARKRSSSEKRVGAARFELAAPCTPSKVNELTHCPHCGGDLSKAPDSIPKDRRKVAHPGGTVVPIRRRGAA